MRKTFDLPVPWGNCLGLARTLIALGTAATLVFSETDSLFGLLVNRGQAPYCDGVRAASVFCVAPDGGLEAARWICVAVCLLAASGWRPRFTCIPHWYVAASLYNSISIPDGGDQAASVLALLLIPVGLTDPRRWHWQPTQRAGEPSRGRAWSVAVGAVFTFAVQLQVAGVYFQASVAKLSHQEWADGTALYYWGNDLAFGAPSWFAPFVHLLTSAPLTVALLTWVPLFIEFGLFLCLFLPLRARPWLLAAGFLLHLCIALMMGLWSFAFVMWGALLVLCNPIGRHVVREPADEDARTEEPAAPESRQAAEEGPSREAALQPAGSENG
ncbi:sporulation-delaying protein SdpB family protein [Streptomyces xiaopingdaonensis]|uniref:sporulation-delaying protein SdpB family protein n=1 Tax=Streptomyces xiaopingdaonensis TaxID=1565415 RepID=UPI0002D3E7A1|nr:sporulation-delaying protein SdpB family protein [Streptomyces xiaopingdaonensis]